MEILHKFILCKSQLVKKKPSALTSAEGSK